MFRDVKQFQDSRTFAVAVQAAMICVSIGSIVAACVAMDFMSAADFETSYITQNWQTKPVSEGLFVPHGENCPYGYEEAAAPMTWPGADGYGCACYSGAMDFFNTKVYSSYHKCSWGQRYAGCVEDEGLGPIYMRTWRGGLMCVKREGQAVWDGHFNYNERPNPVDGTCPENYQKCGAADGTYDANYAICQPDNVPCPVTFFVSDNMLGETPETTGWNETTNPFEESVAASQNASFPFINQEGQNRYIYGNREETIIPMELPKLEFTYGFVDTRIPDDYMGHDYGPCFDRDFNKSVTWGGPVYYPTGEYSNRSATQHYNDRCEIFDNRWIQIDSYDEDSFLTENFIKHERCAGLTEGEALDSDYLNSGNGCSLDRHVTAALRCDLKFKELGQHCADDDDICKNIMMQTTCGRLMHLSTPTVAYKTMGIYARQQIYWSTKCDEFKNDIKDNMNPLSATRDSQMANFIINLVCNSILICICIFLGILFSGHVDMRKIVGENVEEERFVYLLQTIIGNSLCVIKIIPAFVCMIVISRNIHILGILDDEPCSDPLTQESLKNAYKYQPKVLAENIAAMILDAAQIILTLSTARKLSYFAANYKPSDQNKTYEEIPDEEVMSPLRAEDAL